MKQTGVRATLFVLAVVAFSLCYSPSSVAEGNRSSEWEKIKDGKLCGISGIGLVKLEKTAGTFLMVHDNKKADQQKVAVLTVQKGKKTEYAPVAWPKDTAQPVDLEALCRVPGRPGDEFLTATSKGEVFHLRFDREKRSILVLKKMSYPDRKKKNFEGLGLYGDGKSLAAVWAHRGKGKSPAVLSWGLVDLKSGKFKKAGSMDLHVPWPEGGDLRSVSDLKIGKDGTVYVSSASDPGDDGPFSSALYVVGKIASQHRKVVFKLQSPPKEIKRLPGHKIEGMVLLPGPVPSFLVGTDNENAGSSIRTVRPAVENR